MRPSVAAFVIAMASLAACGSDGTQPMPSDAPATIPPATTPTTTPPSSTTTVPFVDETSIPLPDDVFAEKVLIRDSEVLMVGSDRAAEVQRQQLWTWTGNRWTSTSVASLFPGRQDWEVPTVTDVVWFAGTYFAFLMGDEASDVEEPTVLVSPDGLEWTTNRLTAAAGAVPVAFTPESPPYPGASAITDAATYRDRLYAVGWTRTGTGSATSLWTSDDGITWSRTELPPISFPNEWGAAVSVGPVGFLVRVGGPIHTGVGVLFSEDGQTWDPVGEVSDLAAVAISQNAHFAHILRLDLNDTGKVDILWSEDGDQWNESPPVPLESGMLDTLGTGLAWDPVAFSRFESGDVWMFDRGTWSAQSLPGVERVLAITESHFVGADETTLYVFERWRP